MKTIDIQAKEWFDKINGNSYFSALVTIDLGLDTEKTIYVPFQYGYESHYKTVAIEQLQKDGILPNEGTLYWRWFSDNNIEVRSSKKTKCLKNEVIV